MCVSGVIGVASVLVSRDADDNAQDMIGLAGCTRALAQATRALRVISVDDVAGEITTGKPASHSSHDASKRSVDDNVNDITGHPESIQIIVGHHFPRSPPSSSPPSSSFASSSRYLRITSAMFFISGPTAPPPERRVRTPPLFVLVLVVVFVFFVFVGAQRSPIHILSLRGRVCHH